ncbi:glycosyltransferase family protein 64 C3 isoform X1 [Primulina huaijiensis]|uniref:glycosyltransferase family protein 64 C3 isoform X1 n=1 Tax=Primulina huaijiensis TaxID=1492673 RepID=UPI003CC71489
MGIVTLPFLLAAIIFFPLPLLVISLRTYPNSQTPPCNKPDPKSLRSDRLTVVINGYSEHRIPLLQSIAEAYSVAPQVAGVVILWCNPSTSSRTLSRLSQNVSAFVHLSPSSSLNSRFYPWEIINTRAVLICDDDIMPATTSVSFAFTVWKSDPDRIVGFFARSHAYDIASRSWIYTMERDKYSIILTKLMILDIKYLEKYSCSEEYAAARQIVDKINNCEDILMNFVVADEIGRGPLMVGAKGGGIRDHGDSRNEDVSGGVAEVGLSSRRREHRKRRGECIREFHRILGRMPLKYSYGKVVDDVGEQGLCVKAGKVVLCDQQQDFSQDSI